MKYVLAIGLLVKPYKAPNMQVFLNDTLMDDIILDEEIKEKDYQFKLFYNQYSQGKSTYVSSLPEKFFVYHIPENNLHETNYVKIKFNNVMSNYNNGFVSKTDQYLIHSLFFAPENLYFHNKENFISFDQGILKENNFTWDNDDHAFYNKKTRKVETPGWPSPSKCENTGEPYNNQKDYYKGNDSETVYKTVKKYGIHQFELDIENIGQSFMTQSDKWFDAVKDKEDQKIWPILNPFLCFCYHNKDNKYLHEDHRSNC